MKSKPFVTIINISLLAFVFMACGKKHHNNISHVKKDELSKKSESVQRCLEQNTAFLERPPTDLSSFAFKMVRASKMCGADEKELIKYTEQLSIQELRYFSKNLEILNEKSS